MTLPAHGLALDQRRPVPTAGAFGRLSRDLVNLEHVITIHRLARKSERLRSHGDILDTYRFFNRNRNGEAVILTDHHEWHSPQGGHIGSFVEHAFIRSPIAKKAESNQAVAPDLVGQSHTCCNGNVGRDDGIRSQKPYLWIAQMHGTPFPLAVPGPPAKDLSHDLLRVPSLCQHLPMPTVGGQDLILPAHRRDSANCDGLLGNAGVGRPADEALAEQLNDSLLKVTDERHLAVKVEHLCLGQYRGLQRLRHSPNLP